ncbi:MAG TPA: hypothetical protein V6C86_17780 [Oculatellaceae cyanobacterium]
MIKDDVKDIFEVKRAHDQFLAKFVGVTGIYTGIKRVSGKKTGTLSIVVIVKEKKPISQLSPEQVIPAEIEGFPTDVIVGDVPRPLPLVSSPEDLKQSVLGINVAGLLRRPLAGGAQIVASVKGQQSIGTLGCFVKDQSNNYYFLTNQHAAGRPGTTVCQPVPYTQFAVGTTANAIQNDKIDAAIVKLNQGIDFTNYILNIGSIQGSYNLTTRDVGVAVVQKSGRSTGHTFGLVEAIDYTVTDGNSGLTMTNQIRLESIIGMPAFSTSGDSGSVIINSQNQVVGLLWGGESTTTSACPIADCLTQLGVSLVVDHYPPLYVVHNGSSSNIPTGTCNFASLTTGWTNDAEINPFNPIGVENSPNLAVYNNRIYNIRQGRGGDNVWCQKFDGAIWGPDAELAPTSQPSNYYGTTYAPAMASYFGILNCVKQGANSDGSMWWFKYSDDTWSVDQELPLQTAYAPSLVVYKDCLYCFHTDLKDGTIHYSTYDGGAAAEAFSTDYKAIPSSNPNGGYPSNNNLSTLVFNGKLYCFHTGASVDSNIYCFTFDGRNWSDDQALAPSGSSDNFKTWDAVQAIVWNNAIYCFFIGTDRQDVWYTVGDCGNWSTANSTDIQSAGQVALASIPTYKHVDFDIAPAGGALYVVVEGSQYSLNFASNQWVQRPGNPGENVMLDKIDCQSLNNNIYTVDQSDVLYIANLSSANQDWVQYLPTPPTSLVQLCGLAGAGGTPNTPDTLFALSADGTLYSSIVPDGVWQTNYPNTPPAVKLKALSAIPQQPNTPGTLYAVDRTGALWSTAVPGGSWSKPSGIQPPNPLISISAINWVLAISENGPIVQTNLYAIDTTFNFWGMVLGGQGWTQNFPSTPPARLAKLFPSVAVGCAGATYAADTSGNFYVLYASNYPATYEWKTNFPAPLPPPD